MRDVPAGLLYGCRTAGPGCSATPAFRISSPPAWPASPGSSTAGTPMTSSGGPTTASSNRSLSTKVLTRWNYSKRRSTPRRRRRNSSTSGTIRWGLSRPAGDGLNHLPGHSHPCSRQRRAPRLAADDLQHESACGDCLRQRCHLHLPVSPEADAGGAGQRVGAWLDKVHAGVGAINTQIEQHNRALEAEVRRHVTERRARLLQNRRLTASLEIPYTREAMRRSTRFRCAERNSSSRDRPRSRSTPSRYWRTRCTRPPWRYHRGHGQRDRA